MQLHNVKAIGPLVAEASGHLTPHLAFILPRLLCLPPLQANNAALKAACAASTLQLALALEEEGTSELVRHLLKLLDDTRSRAAVANLIRDWVTNTKVNFEVRTRVCISADASCRLTWAFSDMFFHIWDDDQFKRSCHLYCYKCLSVLPYCLVPSLLMPVRAHIREICFVVLDQFISYFDPINVCV